MDLDVERWENANIDRSHWRLDLTQELEREQEKRKLAAEKMIARWKRNNTATLEGKVFIFI